MEGGWPCRSHRLPLNVRDNHFALRRIFDRERESEVTVLGIDEETAIVGGPSYWTVKGRSSAWRLSKEGREQLVTGTSVTTPLN